MNCMISIIIPIYKVEKYLKRCIDSVLKQTYTKLEVILVDDGSPDKSPDICDEYAAKDKRVRTIHQKNAGVSAARNAGLDNANGNYICFIDSDDRVELDYIERLYKSMIENDSDFCVCGSILHKFGKSSSSNVPDRTFAIKEVNNECANLFLGFYMFSPWAKMFKKEIIEKHKLRFLLNCGYAEDTLFVFDYLNYVNKVSFISQDLYHYNMIFASATKKHWDNMDSYLSNRYIAIKKFLLNKLKLSKDQCCENLCKLSESDLITIAENYVIDSSYDEAVSRIEGVFNMYCDSIKLIDGKDKDYVKALQNRDYKQFVEIVILKKNKRLSSKKAGIFLRNVYKQIWSFLYRYSIK